MSLNGLDTDAVVKAHQTTQADAGAWFLLKYASRDTVELLGNGSGGVAEVRGAVDNYEEKSPLYGMVHYRRKRVVLKYVPEGTSRLLQVRLAVQFQSITDTFVPHDHIFSFVAASELTESALGLATMQLQAGGSLSSSTSSLRGHRLDEIAEDSEDTSTQVPAVENSTATKDNAISQTEVTSSVQGLPASGLKAKALLAQRHVAETPDPDVQKADSTMSPSLLKTPEIKSAVPLQEGAGDVDQVTAIEKSLSPTSASETTISARRDQTETPTAIESGSVLDNLPQAPNTDFHHVPFSKYLPEAESSSISRWTDEVVASTLAKSKQKRAPRPHVDTSRPKTSGTTEENTNNKRANLPHSIRVSARPPSSQSYRPGSQQSSRSVPARFVPSQDLPPPLPSPRFESSMKQVQTSAGRPAGSVASSGAFDGPAPSPEKLRLMKALQLRKRAQLLNQRTSTSTPSHHVPMASIGSSISALSDTSVGPVSTVSALSDHPSPNPESITVNESNTSPTSVITVSEDRSTKPSSISELSSKQRSESSLSSETNSSTTPRADVTHSNINKSNKNTSMANVSIETSLPTANFLKILSNSSTANDEGRTSVAKQDEEQKEDDRGRHRPEVTLHAPLASGLSARPVHKRQNFQGSIHIPPSATMSDISDSESFMEELQNATFQEAKPVSVNRTPVTPVLSRHSDKQSTRIPVSGTRESSKSPGTTPEGRRAVSRAGSARSISTALPQWPPPASEPPVPALPKQKPVVSSSISKRVRAFEGLTNRENPPSGTTSALPSPSRALTFSTIMKRTSFFSPNPAPSTTSDKAPVRSSTATVTSDNGELGQEQPLPRPWVQRPGSSTEIFSPSHKNETITVTARIVRTEQRPKTSTATQGDSVLNLRRSPLIVEHETNERPVTRPQASRETSTISTDTTHKNPFSKGRRFSLTSHKSNNNNNNNNTFSPVESTNRSSLASSHNKGSRATSETSSIAEDKRASRTSRMLKRISGFGGRKNRVEPTASPIRDSITQPDTIHERNEPDSKKLSNLQVVDIGEINVQFPESLLWKRRFLRVDDQGNILFAPPSNDFNATGKSRKFHLSEFHQPALPDVEHQEMAWSIILDLKDGRCIQCACESKSAQRKFLKMLLDAHSAYTQLYGD